jgi:hypothetical protein
MQLRLGQMVIAATQDNGDLVAGAAGVGYDVGPDPSGRGASEVLPQRLATASAQVVRVVRRQEKHSSAEAVLRNPQPTLVEIPLERLSAA